MHLPVLSYATADSLHIFASKQVQCPEASVVALHHIQLLQSVSRFNRGIRRNFQASIRILNAPKSERKPNTVRKGSRADSSILSKLQAGNKQRIDGGCQPQVTGL